MGKEALLPGSIEPGKFYDFIGDKEAFNDLGLEEGEVIVFMIKMVSELKTSSQAPSYARRLQSETIAYLLTHSQG